MNKYIFMTVILHVSHNSSHMYVIWSEMVRTYNNYNFNFKVFETLSTKFMGGLFLQFYLKGKVR